MTKDVRLSRLVTVEQYQKYEDEKNRERIANFILERFTERYITPLHGDSDRKHGFCTMAISCLMIEALESFWRGWPDTKGKSKKAFRSFFQRCLQQGLELGVFAPSQLADDFYTGVRCGILHQAETTNGWRIRRAGLLYDPDNKTINATTFHLELEKALIAYCDELKRSEWDAQIWQNLRTKMKSVIENCEPRALEQ
ncbi:MAG: hypothetical protein KatS3mg055_1684 [Chloroflexus sp.]|nr:MAG: hypothetical protein KatS3mg055_1684 [Chloroflexus sp.]